MVMIDLLKEKVTTLTMSNLINITPEPLELVLTSIRLHLNQKNTNLQVHAISQELITHNFN